MLHKRSASKADLRKHQAKVAAADAALPEGRPPPALAAQLVAIKPLDILKHEDAWRKEIEVLREGCRRMESVLDATGVVRVVLAEKEAYDMRPLHKGDPVTTKTPLIWIDHDNATLYDLDTVDYDETCACCDRMKESWINYPKSYGKIEPRWRLIGTTRFLCRFCYEKVQGGASLPIIRD